MQLPSLAEIQKALRQDSGTALKPCPVTILGNVAAPLLPSFLAWLGRRDGLRVDTTFGDFDTVLQDSMADRPDLFGAAGAVVVMLHLPSFSARLGADFTAQSDDAIAAEITRLTDYCDSVLAGIRRQTTAAILWHCFEPPAEPAYGILDGQRAWGQVRAVSRLNDAVREVLGRHGNAYLLDVEGCLRRLGAEKFYDARTWHLARSPYSREGWALLAQEQAKFLRALNGRSRKVLVLDCDNVLWGGVVGEDGLAGIRLGSTFPGSAYMEFQAAALSLHRRGVILALASKNNEADVWEVFDKHPDMVLKREHISAWAIDWTNKADNIRLLAERLNLGLDSFVFADDSEFERGLVGERLPMVELLPLSPQDPAGNCRQLVQCSLFDSLSQTAEDRQRGQMYRNDVLRQEERVRFSSLDDYLRSLEMEVTIAVTGAFSVSRVAQLTQRTNQFNLTTRRYSEDEVRVLLDAPEWHVLEIAVADRFGDLGIVGACFLRLDGDVCEIDTLLMSCRALGRRVEDALLAAAASWAKECGANLLVGSYRPTAKNAQVAEFYPPRGFQLMAEDSECRRYGLALADVPAMPEVFKRVVTA